MVPKRAAEPDPSDYAGAPSPTVSPGRDFGLAGADASSVASPALELQARIVQAYAAPEGFPDPEVAPWPAPVRAGVLLGLVAVSWGLVAGGVWAAYKAAFWAGLVGLVWSGRPARF